LRCERSHTNGIRSAAQSANMMARARRARVLIVEDDEATRIGFEQFLREAGYETIAASTFEDAVRALRENDPDILIADVRLGEYNGLQLVATLRRPIPSIIITGFRDPVLEADARKLGADYLVKPIWPAEVKSLIERKLGEAAEQGASTPARRWTRKQITTTLPAQIEQAAAHIIDVSYGGLRFEIESAREQALPRSFSINLPAADLRVNVDLVWTNRRNDTLVCGAEISQADRDSVQAWHGLVDAVS
jgi:two-component system, response regulator RegA